MLIEIDSAGNENSQIVILMRIPLLSQAQLYWAGRTLRGGGRLNKNLPNHSFRRKIAGSR